MSKLCPIRNEKVIYLTCQECEAKACQRPKKERISKQCGECRCISYTGETPCDAIKNELTEEKAL